MKALAPIVAIALVALCMMGMGPKVAQAADEGDSLTAMVSDLEGDYGERRDDLKDPHYLSGVYHFMNGDYDAALNEFLAGLEAKPDNPYLQYSAIPTTRRVSRPWPRNTSAPP